MSPIRTVCLLALVASITASSCKPEADDLPPPSSFNGFKINSTSYEVDSITTDQPSRGGAMHLHSSSAGGGVLTITGDSSRFPITDGTYLYGFSYVRPRVKGTVSICFTPKSDSVAKFCASEEHMPYNTPALLLVIAGGRRSLTMDARPDRFDSVANMLTITWQEK